MNIGGDEPCSKRSVHEDNDDLPEEQTESQNEVNDISEEDSAHCSQSIIDNRESYSSDETDFQNRDNDSQPPREYIYWNSRQF